MDLDRFYNISLQDLTQLKKKSKLKITKIVNDTEL